MRSRTLQRALFVVACGGTLTAHAQYAGIGVTAPTHALHVRAVGTDDPLRLEGLRPSTSSERHALVTDPATGVIRAIAIADLLDDAPGDNLGNHLMEQNLQTRGHWISSAGGNRGIFVDPSGNVGVGTSGPRARLNVNGDVRVGQVTAPGVGAYGYGPRLYFSGGGSPGVDGSENTDVLSIRRLNVGPDASELEVQIGDFTSANDAFVVRSGDVNAPTTRFRVQSNGYVAVGHNAPTHPLHIIGASGAEPLRLENLSTGGTGETHFLVTDPAGGIVRVLPTSDFTQGDDLGDHVMDQTLETNGEWINGDADPGEGMFVAADGRVGVGTALPTHRLHVVGDALVTGNLFVANNSPSASDSTLKRNVAPLTGALRKVADLEGVYYDWRRDVAAFPDMSERRQVGFLAQAVRRVLPEAVEEMPDGVLGVDYGKLTPLLVNAVREQQTQIDGLREANGALHGEVAALREAVQGVLANANHHVSKAGGVE